MAFGLANGAQSTSDSFANSGSSNYTNSWGNSYSSSLNSGQWASAQSLTNAQTANKINAENMAAIMKYNAQEAQKQRDWEEMMSNTAYQRATNDLQAAGLNPILAASASASTPSGGMASSSALQANMANAYTDYESNSENGSESKGSSWMHSEEHSQSTQNMAEQATTLVKGMSDLMTNIKDSNSGKKIKEFMDDVKQGVKGSLWNIDQNVKSVKQWMRNTLGLDK